MSALRPALQLVSLKVWLPLALLATSLVVLASLWWFQQARYHEALQHFSERMAHAELLQSRRALEAVLRRGDGSGLDAVVSELGLNPAVRSAVLVDDQERIVAATRFAWRGRLLGSIAGLPEAQLLAEIRSGRRERLLLDSDALRLLALAPVTLALRPGELRSARQGVLLIDYDLTPVAARSQQQLREQLLPLVLLAILSGLVLWFLARRAILRPLALLRASMVRIGQGDFSGLPQLRGSGELHELGAALIDMAGELQARRAALADSEARFRQLAEAAFEAIIFHDEGRITDANGVAERLMAVEPGGLIGRNIFELVAEHDRDVTRQRMLDGLQGVWEVDLQDSQGVVIPTECSVREQLIGGRLLRVVAGRDVRARLAAEAEIRQLAHVDALTGLANRRLLLERVSQELEEGDERARRAALATFNLDAFKSINDSLGMAVGDAVLRGLARRLSSLVDRGEVLARVDGDTFALLLCDLQGDLQQASAYAERRIEEVLEALAEPIEVHNQSLHLSAVAGLVMIPNDSREPAELLREAETAMHLAKQTADRRVQFFAHALQEAASARLALRNDLQRVLRSGSPGQQLQLHYQPQLDQDSRLQGVEALVRWNHPLRGMIAPAHFIGEAEDSGLIVPLGHWVLDEAVNALQRWRQQAESADWARALTMAVNVSPRQFREADFVSRVEKVLEQVGVGVLSLELELTESVLADDLELTLAKMEQLRRYGVRFALDDFGTGYSSLAYLRRLPIDTLKIDRSFVSDMGAEDSPGSGRRPAMLVDAIIAMAHQLGMRVLAEGVEHPAQLERLQRSGCDSYQGYLFSRPLDEAALQAWAKARNGSAFN